MADVTVVTGAGAIGQAIARRVSPGRHVLLADLRRQQADEAAKLLQLAGYETTAVTVDVSDRRSVQALVQTATRLGDVKALIQAAGVSPSQAPVETILKVDLYGTAVLLEEFGKVIAPGGSGIVISSQSGYRMPALTAEQDAQLATAPAEDLLNLPFVREVGDTLHAYQMSKRGNSLRVRGEALRWGERGARINAISPGIIITPLAHDELNGERADFYRDMLSKMPAGRAGTPDEVAALAALIMGPEGGYITGSDLLMDGGATASFFHGPKAGS
ncbi:NAD(P)-dependent dehydrogenase, short-chain alcohol dehydrogenase family [Paracoccus halophilus]|uniref:NAD(P)-dependent dehydrogenase, short-chain alcohol dehydrogenase family n=2 Tax=Paracoccus halophilus TaxID=376733 RepID=A0A099EVW2_9RHOB|nr:SDR family oxidoreductase [Paracoccus halophilus]KGJ02161.1 short-chain dehydrogenase [Paracoccus halophilus]SFA62296.1 NAD(P)-dependent dehydrogenase, short-chain alcohol dehydrogenase family [Paracoccus halophilus]